MIYNFIINSFIKWGNFTDSAIIQEWALNLFFIFLIAFSAIFFSNIIVHLKRPIDNFNTTTEFVLRCLTGLALISFGFSIVGLLGFFNREGAVFVIILLTVLSLSRSGLKAFQYAYLLIKKHIWQNKFFWLVAIIISLNSLLLPFRNDEVTYHIAYPKLWYWFGEIFLDDTLRYPTYTFNFHVLSLFGFIIKSTSLVHLIHWLVAVLGAFFIKGIISQLTSNRFFSSFAFFAFLFTPVIQEFINTFYIDIPYQVYLFCSVILLAVLVKNKSQEIGHWLMAIILCAFFIGVKITGILYLPLFVFFILFPLKYMSKKRLIVLAALVVFSSFWYIRSFYLTGDPIWPAINLNLFGEDIFWNKEDLNLMSALIKKTQNEWGWKIIYLLPIELISSKIRVVSQGWPVLSYVLIGVIMSFFFIRKGLKDRYHLIIITFFFFTLFIWLATSIQTRYTYFLLFTLYFSLYVGFKIYRDHFNQYGTIAKYSFYLLMICVLMFSTPNPISFSKQFWGKELHLNKRKARFQAAYSSNAINSIYKLKKEDIIEKGDVIYTFGFLHYRYYFYDNELIIKGDNFGLYRNRDFENSIKKSNALKKFSNYGADYILIDIEKYGALLPSLIDQNFQIIHKNNFFVLGKF